MLTSVSTVALTLNGNLFKLAFIFLFFAVAAQTWCRLVQDYQSLNRQLEAVEANIPTAGLVEESEERLVDRISLYQVYYDITEEVWPSDYHS